MTKRIHNDQYYDNVPNKRQQIDERDFYFNFFTSIHFDNMIIRNAIFERYNDHLDQHLDYHNFEKFIQYELNRPGSADEMINEHGFYISCYFRGYHVLLDFSVEI